MRNVGCYLTGEQLTCESGGPDSLRLHLPLMCDSARFARDASCCHDTNSESAPAFSVVQAPFRFLTSHYQYHGLRDRVFVRFTAQHLGHHLRAPVGHPARERGGQSAARPAAGPDETGGEVHTSASKWICLTLRHVR